MNSTVQFIWLIGFFLCSGLSTVFANEVITTDSSFITTWKTNNPGTSDSTSITIPTHPSTNGYNYDIDWDNDGIFDELGVDTTITHDFGTPGTYTIRIRGNFPHLYFNGEGDKEKLIDIAQWGAIPWKTMFRAFQGCSNLNISSTDAPDLSNVENLTSMFFGCTAFNSNVNHWDVSNVSNFYFAFGYCSNFNQPLNNWDMSGATNLQSMFIKCLVFNQPLGQWDVSNVKGFGSTFHGCTVFNQPLHTWDVSSATQMASMFMRASSFNQDIGGWDVSNVKFMHIMFREAVVFNQDISNWNVSNVINMNRMFNGASVFNQDIGDWDVGQVTDMEGMFAGAKEFDQDIGLWDVSKVTRMTWMFSNANSFNQDIGDWDVGQVISTSSMFRGGNLTFNQNIGDWDVSSVEQMHSMFEHNPSFDQNIGTWDVSNVINMTRMFNYSKLSTPNYDSLLIGWNALALQDSVDFHGGYSIYCAGWAARANMINSDGWMITDGGAEQDAPIALCKDTTIYLEPSGTFNIDASVIDLGSYDSCTVVDLFASQTSFDCSDIGVIMDTLTVIDKNGNQSYCISNIIIKDTPFTLNCPADITVNVNANDCKAIVNWDVPLGYCITSITANKNSGDLFPLGTTIVTYTSIDGEMVTSNCSFTVTVENDLAVEIDSLVNPSCLDDPSGQAFVSVTGGAQPYSYVWDQVGSSPGNMEDPDNLMAGVNRVTITDNFGCTVIDSLELVPIALNIVNCPANQTLKANIAGCTAIATWAEPLEICSEASLLSTFVNGDTFNLGTTTVTYLASNLLGDTATCSFEITVDNDLEIAPDQISNPNCFETNDGAISISVQGGTMPYAYDWNNDGSGDFDDSKNLNQLPAGEYTLQILDAAGCQHSETIQLTQPEALEIITETVQNPSCPDSQDGQISVLLNGGTTPYTLDWNHDGTGDFDDPEDLNNLNGGSYIIEMVDDAGCTKLDTFLLQEPETIVISAMIDTLSNTDSRFIDLDVEGGTAPYYFDWNMDEAGDFDDLEDVIVYDEGIYSVIVIDDEGCASVFDISINIPQTGCDIQTFNLYPNPNSGTFTVIFEGCEALTQLEIFDVLGRRLFVRESTEVIQEFDMTRFPGEAYFLRISTDEESFIIPFAITRE